MKQRVLITGMSGCIGSILYRNLNDSWQVSGIDARENDAYPVTVMNISDTSGLAGIIAGAYAVVHLAANASVMASWEEVLESNIRGTQNVFETAALAGVKKIIFASSNHVTGLYEQEEPYRKIIAGDYQGLNPQDIPMIDRTFPIKPDSYYGVSKAFGEALGRYYAERYGLQVICLRIGTVNRQNHPLDVRQCATLFLHADLVKMVDRCLRNEELKFEIFYGVSNNTWRFWDISNIQRELNWEPEENAENFRKI